MKTRTIKTFALLLMSAMMLTCCGKDNDDIVGSWQWTETSVHHVDYCTGEESTENINSPVFKDLDFHENGKVEVQQQGIYIPENEPPYFTYQYNYSLNKSADTVQLTDPQGEYASQTWRIKSLTDEDFIVEWTEDEGAFTYTATYRRR